MSNLIKEVSFRCHYSGKNNWENDDDDDISCYINIESPEDDILGQQFPDEIVIPFNEILIKYMYPLSKSVVLGFKSNNDIGFTRAELARKICDGYHQIYNEEESAVGNPGNISGMLNRASSEGHYGIYGHHIGDLVLHSVRQIDGNMFGLGVDS